MKFAKVILAALLLTACGASLRKNAITKLRSSSNDERTAAAEFLIDNDGAKALPEIADVLKAEFPEIRHTATWCIARLKDERAIPYLVKMEDDKDQGVRATAVEGLGLFGRRGIQALQDLMSPGHKVDVRSRAAWVLGQTGDTGVFDSLVVMLEKRDAPDEVRAAAARALGCLNDPKPYQPLYSALDDDRNNSTVRCGAAIGLVSHYMFTSNKGSMDLMSRLITSGPTQEIRSCAAWAHAELYEPSNLGIYCNPDGYTSHLQFDRSGGTGFR